MPRASPSARALPVADTATALQRYRARRDFSLTPEPADDAAATPGESASFVIQKHDATRLHYDFRLELDGVLLSWAVPKGPSLDPSVKRMAVRTEDHPLAYGGFEGRIPAGQYGAGTVIVWDRGHWQPVGDARAGLAAGKLAFDLDGDKLAGRWELVRMKARDGEKQETWLLFKKRDAQARAMADCDVVSALPDSVLQPPRRQTGKKAAAASRLTAGPAAGTTPDGARAAPLPETLSPQLALLTSAVPRQGRWLYETKFDGYRLLVRIEAGVPRLITRGGHDWTDRMPALAAALAALKVGTAWLDGEIVAGGAPHGGDFNALQKAFDRTRSASRRAERGGPDIAFVVFDLPYFEGHDLRDAPLYARRELLQQWLQPHLQDPDGALRLSPALGEGGAEVAEALLQGACTSRLEGLIAKRADSPYRGARSADWLKLKCHRRQEFVVGGYAVRSDDPSAVGSLMLGVHDAQGRLQHAGSVGTGWSTADARALLKTLRALDAAVSPFEAGSAASGRWSKVRRAGAAAAQWVRPRLVVEVSFGEWTPAGHIRHASFIALRSDKAARAIVREEPISVKPGGKPAAPAREGDTAMTPTTTAVKKTATPRARPASKKAVVKTASDRPLPQTLKVSHPERIIDAASGHTKLDLVRYYDSVAEFMLPHLAGRPVALVRAPGGVGAPSFFQKHGGKIAMPGVHELDAALWPGHDALLEVRTPEALLAAAQMNVIEFHTWNSTTRQMRRPDRMIFDLDPGEGVGWPAIREGAQLTRTLLSEIGLQSWLKTSGGKGLHVVVPLASRWDFTTVKAFSKAVVEHLAAHVPARFVAKSGPAHRKGRIFVDYLRNGEGATTVAAFSARARPGLGVSMPIDWEELASVKKPDAWTVANAVEHLSTRRADPWAGMAAVKQSLVGPMKALGFNRPEAAERPARRSAKT